MNRRSLRLRRDPLAELTPEALHAVVGGQETLLKVCLLTELVDLPTDEWSYCRPCTS